ncbi:MAG: sulfite exporter TauE/SafE family protein [Saprospiraceae bacterium]|nr:sulfite exporter TauE/SafE family protein [Saprospiraceae bacterium]
MDFYWWFYILLFIVAFLYASVGHGGASGYLALMALAGFAPAEMRPTALILNLFVSATSFIQYYRGGHFKLRIFWPFILASIPMAFWGGRIDIDDAFYKQLLGILLLVPIIRFIFYPNPSIEELKKASPVFSLGIGAMIGFLSGLIGIGGGILLSPVLLLLKWTDQKQTAAISALFILINSASGLIGQWTKGIQISSGMFLLVVVAFVGGLCGAFLGSLRFDQKVLKYILAAVLMLAAFKLLTGG